jgi:cytoskeletal protein CcmA (bactofilin family)
MSDTTRPDMTVNGGGSIGAGGYNDVIINGAGTVTGDLDCATLKINGAGTCEGAVKATTLVVNGSGSFLREVQAGEMTINGDASITMGAGIGRLKVKGRASTGGSLAAHEVDLRGTIKVDGDCSADTFVGEGVFTIGGLLNAGVVHVQLYGPCAAREIGGEKVTIAQSRKGLAEFVSMFSEKRLRTDTIEADEIWIENTTARVVRGATVTIGSGCDIMAVEYTDTLNQAPDARVGEARKVEA